MKILAISYLYPNKYYPEYGIFVLNRLKAISKYCEVKVINPIPWFPFYSYFKPYKNYHQIPKKEVINGIEVFHPRFFIIPHYFKLLDALTYSLTAIPFAMRLRKKFIYDLIDVHWTYPDLVSGYMLSKMLHKKNLITIRGKESLNIFLQYSSFQSNEKVYHQEHSIRTKILKYLIPKSNFVITLSKELEDICTSYGVSSQKIKTIRNGVDISTFRLLEKKWCRLKLGLPLNERIILSVGSLTYGKGFDRIIRVFPEILKQYPNSALYIIGSDSTGYFKNNLLELVKQKNCKEKVRFVGQINNNNLPLWYNAADIFCLASRSEGSPNVLTEALACGCPSVATDVGSVSEILTQDFMGTVIPNHDESLSEGLLSVFSRKFDRIKISEFMRQYDWDWCGKKVLETYKMLLDSSN